MLVEGGGEAVVAQAGLERIHPLGRTIHMFWRLAQRRPAAGETFNRGKLSTQKIRHKFFGLADATLAMTRMTNVWLLAAAAAKYGK